MYSINKLLFYPTRFFDEVKKTNNVVESVYRDSYHFLKKIKLIDLSNPNQIRLIYNQACSLVDAFKSLKKTSTIGIQTSNFIKELNASLIYCKGNKLMFCVYVRSIVFNDSLASKIANELYDYLKSVTFVYYFQNDYDRIVSASSFRRLQDKAQIFSLEPFDYVRTRLTHSNEVSAISEQIVTKIMFEALLQNNANKRQMLDLISVCRCASLLHDLGNPPFGHYGERIITTFFNSVFSNASDVKISHIVARSLRTKKRYVKDIIKNKRMIYDFITFDGNAQAFRIVNSLQQYRDKSSLNLTASVLRSIIKYPCDSVHSVEQGKFGYFYSEQDIINFLIDNGGYHDGYIYLPALIMETSDDIAYNISDFEDSIKKGLITYEDIVNADVENECKEVRYFFSQFKKYYRENKKKYKNPFETTLISQLQNLKISLISECAYVLSKPNRHPVFLDRTVKNRHVIKNVPSYSICVFIKEHFIKPKVYSSKSISQNELEADKILSYLLDEFTKAVLYVNYESKSKQAYKIDDSLNIEKYKKIINLISPHLIKSSVDRIKHSKTSEEKLYYRLKLVVDYISGMTDFYAKHVYNILTGK